MTSMAIVTSDSFPASPTISSPASASAPRPVDDSTDTIRLSENAQIQLLTQQGQSPAEIALTLGVAVMVVDGYLGVAAPIPLTPESQSGGDAVRSLSPAT
jgi:hypothetical protein